jgi:hypothetical protein
LDGKIEDDNTTSIIVEDVQGFTVQDESGTPEKEFTVDNENDVVSTEGNEFRTGGGDIDTEGGNVDANDVTATGTVQGQTVTATNELSVDPGANVDMGMNRVQGVADPVDPYDAANKRYVDQEINKAFDEIDKNSEGIALAMAMSGLSLPSNANFAIGAQFGFFDDEQAIAAQGALRLDQNFTLIGGVGVGLGDDSPVGGRIGVQAAF